MSKRILTLKIFILLLPSISIIVGIFLLRSPIWFVLTNNRQPPPLPPTQPQKEAGYFLDHYLGLGSNNSCNREFFIWGKEPLQDDKFPVFIFLGGTTGNTAGPGATLAIDQMVKRGFLAASVEYDNRNLNQGCRASRSRARCIFDQQIPLSATEVICARPKADCTKGIVVSGISQGGVIALLAKDYHPQIQAAYALSVGNQINAFGPFKFDLHSCVNSGKRQLADERIRIVNGEQDALFGENPSEIRARLEEITNLDCPADSLSCFRPNGSGWYLVQNKEVEKKIADHCYFLQSKGCQVKSPIIFDRNWAPPAENEWSLETNLSWLNSFIK